MKQSGSCPVELISNENEAAVKFVTIGGKSDKKESIVRTYDRSTIKRKIEQIDVNKLLLNAWSSYFTHYKPSSRMICHPLLEFSSVIGWVDFCCPLTSFSDFLQINMVGYRYMVGWPFEYFIFVAKVRALNSKSVLNLMNFLHLLFIFAKNSRISCVITFTPYVEETGRFRDLFHVFFLFLSLFALMFAPSIKFQFSHVSGWLHCDIFNFV